MGIKPRGKIIRSNEVTPGYVKLVEPQVQIAAWSPRDDGVDPEQVHFNINFPAALDMPPLVMRFKSPDSIGFFIEELIRYRRLVWPGSKKVTGE